jgi:hypothetical protein
MTLALGLIYWLFCLGYVFPAAKKQNVFGFIAAALIGMAMAPIMLGVDLHMYLNQKK